MNLRMTEEHKVHHVTIGIRVAGFQNFELKNTTTVSGIVDICRNFQNARSSRIWLPSLAQFMQIQTDISEITVFSFSFFDGLRNVIRDMDQEEMDRHQLPSSVST